MTKTSPNRASRPRSPQARTAGLAEMLKALGDPTRLRIFEFLAGCRDAVALEKGGAVRRVAGPTVGEVCCRVTGGKQITSTLSHHLKELRQAGLIHMERRGRHMLCGVNRAAVAALAAFFRKHDRPFPEARRHSARGCGCASKRALESTVCNSGESINDCCR